SASSTVRGTSNSFRRVSISAPKGRPSASSQQRAPTSFSVRITLDPGTSSAASFSMTRHTTSDDRRTDVLASHIRVNPLSSPGPRESGKPSPHFLSHRAEPEGLASRGRPPYRLPFEQNQEGSQE